MDTIKGLAISLVVIGHVLAWTYSDWHYAVNNYFVGTIAWNIVYSFHMPLFMFISGFVVFNPFKNYSPLDVFRRITSYIIPFLFMGTVLYYYREDPSGIFNYWYLRSLAEYVIVLYVICLIIHKICMTNYCMNRISPQLELLIVPIMFVIVFKLLYYALEDNTLADIIICKRHLNLYSYFIFGWYVRRNTWIEEKVLFKQWMLPFSLIPFYFFIVFGFHNEKILAFSGIFITYNVVRHIVGSMISKKLGYIGKYSMEIYILHFFFLFAAPSIGDYFLTITHLPTAISLQFSYGISVSIIIIYLSMALAKIIHKNSILSYLFFGK